MEFCVLRRLDLHPTHNLKVVDLHGLVCSAAGAESLHVVGRVNLHRALLYFAVDAHAVVDIVDLHTHTHKVSDWHVRHSPSHPTPSPLFFTTPPHPLSPVLPPDFFPHTYPLSSLDFSFTQHIH